MDNPFEILLNEVRELKEMYAQNSRLLEQALKEQTSSRVDDDDFFTIKQLAEYWQCHPQTIMQKKRKGELSFHQHGRKIFFKKSEIDALTANPVYKTGI